MLSDMMIRFLYLSGMLLIGQCAFAQVGFNNPAPDPTSILDLTANDKGLLIPRLTTAQREAIVLNATPGRSLLVFDTTDGIFYFYDGGEWFALNEWVRKAGSKDVSVQGTVTAPNYALNATGNGPIPKGGIIMWSGTVAEIPTGWALCDGQNGRPNLTDRFIVGAGASYAPKATGGSDQFSIAQSNLPLLTHTITVTNSGAHQHPYTDDFWLDQANDQLPNNGYETLGGTYRGAEKSDLGNDRMYYRNKTIAASGVHNHTASSSTHGQATPVQIDNRPRYFALAFIIKL
jgi:microcystin-dependent protein